MQVENKDFCATKQLTDISNILVKYYVYYNSTSKINKVSH